MPQPVTCNPCCSDPVVVDVIGSPGLQGNQGDTGEPGPAGPAAELETITAFSSGTQPEIPEDDTPVLISFGTVQPSVVLTAGDWLINARMQFSGDAVTLTTQILEVLIRCINNTPNTVDGSNRLWNFTPVTTTTGTLLEITLVGLPYTALAGDNLQLWAAISGAVGAGAVLCQYADITAVKIAS